MDNEDNGEMVNLRLITDGKEPVTRKVKLSDVISKSIILHEGVHYTYSRYQGTSQGDATVIYHASEPPFEIQ